MFQCSKLFFFSATLLLLSTTLTLHAASPRAEALAAHLNHLQTMQAEITQTTIDQHGKILQTSHGNMALSRPDKFRWEIKKPIPQLIIVNHQQMIIYDPDLAQATIRPFNRKNSQNGALFLNHDLLDLDKQYTIKTKQEPHATWFILTPKSSADHTLSDISLQFTNDSLVAMRLYDPLGRLTDIRFKSLKNNSPLSNQLFTFHRTPSIDVVEER